MNRAPTDLEQLAEAFAEWKDQTELEDLEDFNRLLIGIYEWASDFAEETFRPLIPSEMADWLDWDEIAERMEEDGFIDVITLPTQGVAVLRTPSTEDLSPAIQDSATQIREIHP